MGRLLKNTVFKSGSNALGLPSGTSAERPGSPVNGQTRYSTTSSKLEFYNNSVWNAIAKEGTATITKDSFTGNNVATNFTMTSTYTAGQEPQALVFVNTVYQNPGINYTFNGSTTITFTSAPPAAAVVLVLHGIGSTTAA
jgi:hypothetical protein